MKKSNGTSAYSGKLLHGQKAILCSEAIDYLRSLGHLVSNKAFILTIFVFVIITLSSLFVSAYTTTYLNSTGITKDLGICSAVTSAQVYNQTWLNFDGVNDYINVTNTNLFLDPYVNNNYSTVSIWFKSNNWTTGDGSNARRYIFYFQNSTATTADKIRLYLSNTTTNLLQLGIIKGGNSESITISNNLLNRNVWHNVIFSFNNGKVNIYLDGNKIQSFQDVYVLNFSSYKGIYFGSDTITANYFNGSIDEYTNLKNLVFPSDIVSLYKNNIKGEDKVFIPIMMRHGIGNDYGYQSETYFRQELQWLYENGFETITDVDYYNWKTFGNFTMPSKPIIYIFDDGVISINTTIAYIMSEYGFKGVMSLNSVNIGSNYSKYMNWSNVNYTIQNYNWSVASHSQFHCAMVTPGEGSISLNCTDSINRQNNMSMGLLDIYGNTSVYPITFVYPYNNWNVTTMNECRLNYSICVGSSYTYELGNYVTLETNLTNGNFSRLNAEDYSNTNNFSHIFNYTFNKSKISSQLKFNENSGTTAYDSSGNGNNGTISGATWQNDGVLLSLTNFVDYDFNSPFFRLLNPDYDFSNITLGYSINEYIINVTYQDWYDASPCVNDTKTINKTIYSYDYHNCGTFEPVYYYLQAEVSCSSVHLEMFTIDLESKTTIVIFAFLFIFVILFLYFRRFLFAGGLLVIIGFILIFNDFNTILSLIIILGGILAFFLKS